RDLSIAALNAANELGSQVFLVAQRDIKTDVPSVDDLFMVGTVAKIKQSLKTSENNIRVLLEGVSRAKVSAYTQKDTYISARVITKSTTLESSRSLKVEALMREVHRAFDNFAKNMNTISDDLKFVVKGIKSPGLLADFIASNVLIRYTDKQQILEKFEPLARLELLALILENEANILNYEMQIHKKVRSKIDSNQREYYLREQLKVIQNELGYGNDGMSETDEYYEKIDAANLPDEVREKLVKEVNRLAKIPFGSAEGSVIRNYLDVCLELPWNKVTKDRNDLEYAAKILNADHEGLDKLKERVLEFLAVKQVSPNLKNQILCLVGPPGVGKTSVAISIATALNRKYVRVSLGGIRDEADIRGHRKTYIGSMPGRIIEAINKAKSRNPLILLDEVDKLSRDVHGDPASALLEVLDSEQNKNFRDHYIELPIDLSDCIFIATANTLETIPRPLIDRMEIIEMKSYSRMEKLQIAKKHLFPKQLKRHGLTKRSLRIDDDVIFEIIDSYTKEAGVRNLEREIAALCRKTARTLVEAGKKSMTIRAKDVDKYLGPKKVIPDGLYESDEVGVTNGLAYTEYGGDLLKIEAAILPGTGKIELTGSLGDIMKESAKIAVSYLRSAADSLCIPSDFYKNNDIHIHVPEGAVPKDGPSAGITILTSLASALTGRPVRRDIAMTGELTLRGRVLPIGGLREKTMAAAMANVKTVILPADNKKDLCEIDPQVKEKLKFKFCTHASQVLEAVLLPNTAFSCKKQDSKPLPSSIMQIPDDNLTESIDFPFGATTT
ncbi:MAG: endopeptidase La, partial [Clostridiales bacterium]|nr:endopeptidase La [Clostridiales bacterium]